MTAIIAIAAFFAGASFASYVLGVQREPLDTAGIEFELEDIGERIGDLTLLLEDRL